MTDFDDTALPGDGDHPPRDAEWADAWPDQKDDRGAGLIAWVMVAIVLQICAGTAALLYVLP